MVIENRFDLKTVELLYVIVKLHVIKNARCISLNQSNKSIISTDPGKGHCRPLRPRGQERRALPIQ